MSDSMLKDEYKEAYTSIVMYLSSSDINHNFMNEVSEDIKDLLISAQNDGIDVKNIIGSDIEVFCKEIIKSKDSNGKTMFNIFNSVKWALFISAIIALIYYLFDTEFTLNMIFMFIIDFLLCKFVFNNGLRKVIIKNKGNMKKIIMVSLLYILFVIPIAFLNFILLTNFVVEVNSLYTFMVLVAILGLSYIIGSILKKRR